MPIAVTVRPVQSGSELKRFIDFPYTFYRDHPYWVPPLRMDIAKTLNPKKNPFFEHGAIQPFLAFDGHGELVGRVAGIRNGMHLKKYDDGVGFFGFFECVEDYSAAQALLDAAADWLLREGLTTMRGPANPSLNDTAGLLVDGFDDMPSILMPYNPAYYVDFLDRYGFERAMTMWAFYVHKKYLDRAKLDRGVKLLQRRNPTITARTIDMDRFFEEAAVVLDIYNDAWSDNWGHVPMTEREFEHLAKDLKQIVDPDMVVLLEDEGQPIAFSVILPNLNRVFKQIPDGRLLPFGLPKLLAAPKVGALYETRMPLMGVRKDYQGRGLDVMLIHTTMENGLVRGYEACEMSWVLDTNKPLMNLLDKNMGAVRDKEYALFDKELAA